MMGTNTLKEKINNIEILHSSKIKKIIRLKILLFLQQTTEKEIFKNLKK